ncbi:MAG: leucine-rich repeat domain-containing protein [Treponema sp.]|nr:leucine-rich repeat domain-containing protein [Treponema sp.]
MKKTFKLIGIIAFVAIIGLSMAACGEQEQHDPASDFDVETVGGGRSLMITRYLGNNRDVRIPPRIRNLPVTHIGEGAFARSNLTNVTIPNSVTHIGNSAFMQNPLSSVTIPDSVTSIGNRAFARNERLSSVTIPNSVTSIGDEAFLNTNLTRIVIPGGTHIGGAAFDRRVDVIRR